MFGIVLGAAPARAQIVSEPIDLWALPAGASTYILEAAASGSEGLILLAVNEGARPRLWAIRVASDGTPLAAPTAIRDLESLSPFALRASTGGFVAVVEGEVLRIVDGAIVERSTLVGAERADLASDGDTVLASFAVGHIPRAFYTRRVVAAGALTADPAVYVGGIGDTGGTAVLANGGPHGLLFWLSCEGGLPGCARVFQPLSATGSPSAPAFALPRSPERWSTPLIADGIGAYVVVALEGASTDRIVSLRVTPTGRPTGQSTVVLPNGWNEELTALVATADGLLLTYQQPLGSVRGGATRAAFLDSEGAFVGSGDLLVVDGPSLTSSALILGGRSAIVTAERGAADHHIVRMRFVGPLLDAGPCTEDGACRSGYCADGFCCDLPCGNTPGDCRACSVAAGGLSDGYCTPLRVPGEVVCRPLAGPCDIGSEVCVAGERECPEDALRASDTVCGASLGVCDPEERCDGESPACPVDRLHDASQVCRPEVGACDRPEFCNGGSPDCPDDLLWPAELVCRTEGGLCDPAEVCDGVSPNCPENVLAPQSLPCDDGSSCTSDDVCMAGECVGRGCDDGDLCTVDLCEPSGCVHRGACDGDTGPSEAGVVDADQGTDAGAPPPRASCSCQAARASGSPPFWLLVIGGWFLSRRPSRLLSVMRRATPARWVSFVLVCSCAQSHVAVETLSMDAPSNSDAPDVPSPSDAPDAASPSDAPDAWVATCEPIDLGGTLGEAVYEGTTVAAPLAPIVDGCGVEVVWRPAVAFRWTAPEPGVAHMDTLGSELSATLLVRREHCDGVAYVCSQRSNEPVWTPVGFSTERGDVYIVLVSANTPGDPARFRLNISIGKY